MILFDEDFSRVTLGAQPNATTTDYDNTIGDAGDDASGGVVVTAVADDLFGGICANFTNPVVQANTFGFLGKTVTPPGSGIVYLERFYKLDTLPSFRTSILLYKDTLLAGHHLGSFALGGSSSSFKFVLVNGDTNAATSTNVVPTGQWFRVRVKLDLNALTQTADLFLGDNLFGVTPTESFSAAIADFDFGYLEDGILTNPNVTINLRVSHVTNATNTTPVAAVRAVGSPLHASNDTARTYTIPAAAVAGDVLLLLVSTNGNITASATPAGWTSVTGGPWINSTFDSVLAYTRTCAVSDPGATVAVTFSGACKGVGVVLSVANVNTTTPLDAAATVSYNTLGTTRTAPTATSTNTALPILVVTDRAAAAVQTTAAWVYPTGFANVITNQGSTGVNSGEAGIGVAAATVVAPATPVASAATFTGNSVSHAMGVLLMLRDAALEPADDEHTVAAAAIPRTLPATAIRHTLEA